MKKILLHLILPITFYTTIAIMVFQGMNLGALKAYAVSACLVSPVIYYFYKRDQRSRGNTLAISFNMQSCLVAILVFGASCCILGNYVVEVFKLTELSTAYKETKTALYSPSFTIQILAAGLLIPVAEELIFRGMVFGSIRDRLSFWPSAILSACFFGLFHGNLPQGVYAFLIGIAIAWLYEVCKTLLAPYLFHVSANILSLCITNTDFGRLLFARKDYKVMAVIGGISVVVAVVCVIWIYRKNNSKEDIV